MRNFTRSTLAAVAVAGFAAATLGLSSTASAATLTFTQLTGVTGGTPAGTAVYRADLSGTGVGTILSISIGDSNSGVGGATGRFSGFDLDAIRLSTGLCATAACAAGLPGLNVFDFVNGVVFTPGTQRAPAAPKLFGTGVTGTTVDNSIATLGAFDGNNDTLTAFGFVSMGDGGILSFNLSAAASTAGLYLYIGEVGDNGEVAGGNITISDSLVAIPLPGSLPLMLGALALGAGVLRRRR